MSDIELQAGQTAVIRVTKHLEYRVTNTGWTLEVKSTQPICVAPKDEQTIGIGSLGVTQDDEV